MKLISVRESTYNRLKKVKSMLKADSFGEAIDILIDIYYSERNKKILRIIEESRIPEEEVEKVEKAIKEIEERGWW